jgi:hypothetical protein
MKNEEKKDQQKNDSMLPDSVSEQKPAAWGVSTENVSINQNTFPSGHGSTHVNAPGGGYTLSVHGFDHDGYPIVSRWYDDD